MYNQQDATLYNILYYVNTLHVSGGFSPYKELKNCTHSIGYMPSLLAVAASVGELELEGYRTHKRQIFKPLAGLEPAITSKEQPETHALDSAATGISRLHL